MAKGGKYLSKKPVAKKKKGKVLPVILIVLAVLLVGGIGAGVWYYNFLLNQLSRPGSSVSTEPVYADVDATIPEGTVMIEGQVVEETTPEDTWPVIVSDENISNILLVGQAAREGEESVIADTMILCSINRETKTLTMTSLMRDMRLVWPQFIDKDGKPHTGNNRINMAYNMGTRWRGDTTGGMDLLESIVEYNFGVPVDNTIEVNFDVFSYVVDLLGGVTVDISQEEYDYMLKNCNWMEEEGVHVGVNTLKGYHALGYARMRKVGHGDYERTERQREVITSLIDKMRGMGIMEIHNLFTEVLPYITTDMTNKEITNYAFEFIPMLKDLKIQSQRIPFDGMEYTVTVEIDGVVDYQLGVDTKATGKKLRESIGMDEPEASN